MTNFRNIFATLLVLLFGASGIAQKIQLKSNVPEVEWYPVENEKSPSAGRTRVILSGRTSVGANVKVDGESVTILLNKRIQNQRINSVETRANAEGFFELALDLPFGQAQIPVEIVQSEKSQKTFLLTFEVTAVKEQIPINTPVARQKPPAAAKKFRFWTGAGLTHQSYSQSLNAGTDLKFSTVQAPGLMFRGGYWGDSYGFDFYFRDAPGKIEADAPYTIETGKYSWRTAEIKGLYQFDRNAKSRIWGKASQWQLRFGLQSHQVPFLEASPANVITLEKVNFTAASLGIGLLLGQEQIWTYEFALGINRPLSASGPGEGFKTSSPIGFEAQVGGAYKFAPNWRLGIFSYTQSLGYTYEYTKAGTPTSGKQNLFYTTMDLRLGYEF